MAFTVEAMDTPLPSAQPAKAELPSKEFIGYDPNGTTTITGSDRSENVKQLNIVKDAPAPEELALSPKISALARKEQAQRQREEAFKRREAELEARLAKAEKMSQLEERIAKKDLSAVSELGLTYEDYTQYEIDKRASEDPKEERYLKVERELENLKKQQAEREIEEYKVNQNLWKKEISKAISENEEYSTIKELKAEDMVLQHINDSFDEDGVELSVDEAAKQIEEALVERAERFASLSKIKQKFGGAKALGPPKAKTITQNMTVTSEAPSKRPFHTLSESEQIAEAMRRVQLQKQQR